MTYLEYIEKNKDLQIEMLQDLVAIKSIVTDPVASKEGEVFPFGAGVQEVFACFLKKAQELGFETNSDITYRLYDWGRNMPDRPLHVEKVIETVNIPDDQNMGVDIVEKDIDGCKVAYFIDKPGIFTAFRIRVDENCTFQRKEYMLLF